MFGVGRYFVDCRWSLVGVVAVLGDCCCRRFGLLFVVCFVLVDCCCVSSDLLTYR